jgi:hypothetical protein
MKLVKNLLLSVLILFVATCTVQADWDPGDGHKMHYPQLPDPNGWDIDVTTGFVADDWRCSWSGPVDDIHFWVSAQGDNWGGGINFIDVVIYDDIPESVGGAPFSRPGQELWTTRAYAQPDIGGDKFTIRDYGQGDQGWYDPVEPYWIYPDHMLYRQVNIQNIVDPFPQTRDKIYWLEIHIIPNDAAAPPLFGWKTSLDHWNDDAVYEDWDYNWQELYDPRPDYQQPPVSLDMAFVITPEPMTIMLLAAGLPLLIKRKRLS